MAFNEDFWANVQTGPDCWDWRGPVSHAGYGRYGGRAAHRYAWESANDATIPHGMVLCHTCDNRLCVRPSHLWPGTYQENSRDMVDKGRGTAGISRIRRPRIGESCALPAGPTIIGSAHSALMATIPNRTYLP